MTFTQTLTVQAGSDEQLAELLQSWHRDQAGVAPGYEGARVLADRSERGRYLIEVDFSSPEAAQENNDRPETKAWAEDLRARVEGDPAYHDYDVVFATGAA